MPLHPIVRDLLLLGLALAGLLRTRQIVSLNGSNPSEFGRRLVDVAGRIGVRVFQVLIGVMLLWLLIDVVIAFTR